MSTQQKWKVQDQVEDHHHEQKNSSSSSDNNNNNNNNNQQRSFQVGILLFVIALIFIVLSNSSVSVSSYFGGGGGGGSSSSAGGKSVLDEVSVEDLQRLQSSDQSSKRKSASKVFKGKKSLVDSDIVSNGGAAGVGVAAASSSSVGNVNSYKLKKQRELLAKRSKHKLMKQYVNLHLNQDQKKLQNPCLDPHSSPSATATTEKEEDFAEDENSNNNNNNNNNNNFLNPHNRILPSPCLLKPGIIVPQSPHQALLSSMRVSIANFLRVFRNSTVAALTDDQNSPVICTLLLLHTTACDEFEETLFGCVSRLGLQNTEAILPLRCTRSAFWQVLGKFYSERKKKFPDEFPGDKPENEDLWKRLPRGTIPDSTVWGLNEKREYVPPAARNYAKFDVPPHRCKDGTVVHPFGFGIPSASIVKNLPMYKSFDFMPITPPKHLGPRGWGVSISEEQLFREFYSASYFAFTHARGGVDCLRHVEQLAAGVVPHFTDLANVGKYRVAHLPKQLLFRALRIASIEHVGRVVKDTRIVGSEAHEYLQKISQEHIHFTRPGTIRAANFNKTEYFALAQELLNFTQHHLSTGALVASLLRLCGNEDARKILVITRFEYDYMNLCVHSGLSENGLDVTVVGEDSTKYIYKMRRNIKRNVDSSNSSSSNSSSLLSRHHPNLSPDEQDFIESERGAEIKKRAKDLYGGGFGFAARLYNQDTFLVGRDSPKMRQAIVDGVFDHVIYTYIYPGQHMTMPFLHEVRLHMKKHQVAFIDHNDYVAQHTKEKGEMFRDLYKMGNVFSREMPDFPCAS